MDAVKTVTTVEPRQMAFKIHHTVVTWMCEEGHDVNATMKKLRGFLENLQVPTERIRGTRYVGLSVKQVDKLLTILELVLRTGGRFSPYDDGTVAKEDDRVV